MSTFRAAVQDFVEAIYREPPPEVLKRFKELMEGLEGAPPSPEDAGWALMSVIELLAHPHCPYHGFLAMLCERCMAAGSDAWGATGLIIERFCGKLAGADRFAAACRSHLGLNDGAMTLAQLESVYAEVGADAPDDANAWTEVGPLGWACRPILAHFPQARRLFRALIGDQATFRRLAALRDDVGDLARTLDGYAEEAAQDEPPAAAAEEALRRLTETSARGPDAAAETFGALQQMMRDLFCVDLAGRNRALHGLGVLLADRDPGYVGLFSQMCGALVETGCDPHQAIEPMLARLPDVLADASAFIAACAARMPAGDEEASDTDAVQQHGAAVAESMPRQARAFEAVDPLCLGAVALLSRAPDVRQTARTNRPLFDRVCELAGVSGAANFLTKMLRVLDGEELIVLAPEPPVGFRVVIRGVADNFQLHALLAGSVIGHEDRGLFPGMVGTHEGKAEPSPEMGRPLNRRSVGVARDLPCSNSEPSVWSFLQLWTWKALRPDGTVSADLQANRDHVVWNEGVPADIPPFEGKRVVLLGNTPFCRSWNGGRIFHGMRADLRVEEVLSPEAVGGWLRRIAAAPR
jgi:hypothetical protein